MEKNEVLIRLEHFYESIDNNVLSKPIEVGLQRVMCPLGAHAQTNFHA